jgi:S-formylglutathione hydrolase
VRTYTGPKTTPILIDQGAADEFLEKQLLPQAFIAAAKDVPVTYRLQVRSAVVRCASSLTIARAHAHMQAGYDHSYFFISTFIDDHVRLHATALYGAMERKAQ